ncbi:putative ataxin-10-like isoform X1 [Capsicum annuum]|nr:putative ataxin-10-like isoform X1 [Capsicum annuum]
MGSSREIVIGPVAVVSLLLSSMIPKLEDPTANPIAYRKLVLTVTFFAGIFQAAFGLLRLGFLVDFLSHAAIVGFMAGAACVIGLQQLKSLLGIANFTKKTHIISVLTSISQSMHTFNSPHTAEAAKIGLIVALVALTEAIAVGRSFATIKGYRLDGNKEMLAMGVMNITGSLSSSYVATEGQNEVVQGCIFHFDNKSFIVKAWSLEIEFTRDELHTVPIWRRLSGLDNENENENIVEQKVTYDWRPILCKHAGTKRERSDTGKEQRSTGATIVNAQNRTQESRITSAKASQRQMK